MTWRKGHLYKTIYYSRVQEFVCTNLIFQINKILSRIVQRSSPEIPGGDDGEVRDREGREYNICGQIVFAILFGHVQEIYFLIFEYLIC